MKTAKLGVTGAFPITTHILSLCLVSGIVRGKAPAPSDLTTGRGWRKTRNHDAYITCLRKCSGGKSSRGRR